MNNIPAFPTGFITDPRNGQIIGGSNGMTLRDYFAAKALQGMSANPEDVHDANQETYEEYVEEISRCAYKMADAMMKARGV